MTDAPSIYAKARADVAAMLGYDLDALTPEQALRLDVATSLRVLLDSQSGRLVRGESLDARELLMASEALSRLLPPLREPPPAADRIDPREFMWKTYLDARRRGELAASYLSPEQRLEKAQAKVAEIEAELAAGSTAITPPTCDVVPPGEIGECYAGIRPGPDDSPRRSPPVIEGTRAPAPPPAAASAPRMVDVSALPPAEVEPWRAFVNADGSIRSTPRGRWDV
jgi:hypothetical protein